MFVGVEALGGVVQIDGTGLDFDGDPKAIDSDDEVELTASQDDIAAEHVTSRRLRGIGSELFAELRDRAIQI